MIAAAPAILDSAPASTPPAATPAATAAGPSGFDAILLLQSLAATSETLDAAAFEVSDTADLLATDDSDEDDIGEDLESSLAFLSALLTVTTPKGSPGGFETGAQAQGEGGDASEPGAAGANPLAGLSTTENEFALAAEATGKSAEVLLAAAKPEPLETRATGDASQNLARAAEILAQAARPAQLVESPAVATPVRDPRWADDFSARVSLMVRAGESTASLQLTPVDLGPVEVKVTVKDSQATIHFGATQADTRALIEASLPRLRELLASQGFNLLDASVSSGFSRSQQQASAGSGSRASGEAETSTAEARPIRQLGLLDLYA
jgi:flagellar hook-length control protein FliK